jgi:hypothetical protein
MKLNKENIKATWRRMPLWAKLADLSIAGCIVYTGCRIVKALVIK